MEPAKEAMAATATRTIPGYAFGSPDLPRAPIDLQDLDLLRKAMGWSERDEEALRRAATILEPRIEEILDVWYGFLGSQPHLIETFARPGGAPDEQYLSRVRARFGQWIRDTLAARQDQAWLDYQFEIGRRHHRSGKNRTDGVDAAPHVPLRYVIALLAPITHTVRPFLEEGAPPKDAERMLEAWHKAVLLQLALWTYPYVEPGDF